MPHSDIEFDTKLVVAYNSDEKQRLRVKAAQCGLNTSEAVRVAIQQWIEKPVEERRKIVAEATT